MSAVPLSAELTPTRGNGAAPKVVLVQSGARDAYQVALALEEAGLLETMVTDLFWPADKPWAQALSSRLPRPLSTMLRQRSEPRIRSQHVALCAGIGVATLLLDKWKGAPPAWKRYMTRQADARLGTSAGRRARRSHAALLSYSYYAYDAFRAYGKGGMLFQLHPHPASMRRLLREELEAHPDCAASLQQEWELALPEEEFEHLCAEAAMASTWVAASSFTRQTLAENGIAPERVHVTPYGVDTTRFSPGPERVRDPRQPLRLLFVGRINQRKGIKYLIDAVRSLTTEQVELTVCGRVVDDLSLFRPLGDRVRIRPDVSAAELAEAYRAADLFVFPSVAEGFGQVLLEALASGLPILSTTHTAAPDLIDEGVEGFIVEPRRADVVADRLAWALDHRDDLVAMRSAARRRAESFTWERFRAGIVRTVLEAQHAKDSGSRAGLGASHAL